MVRYFIAVYPIKSEIVLNLQKRIKQFIEGKAVEKENLHITLSFLGEKDEKEINEIKAKLDKISRNHNKREAILTRIKFIPNERFFRVIAIDVNGLEDLSESIEKEVGGDIKPPHLTLFRIKNVKDKKALIETSKREINEIFIVDKISLMKSTLTPKGPIYEIESEFKLSD
jgi:RNA 2',3'-cyclic 3'-phosphodiesterase